MSELNVEISTEIFQKVYELDLEMFLLLCKIDRYKDKMTEPIYKYMAQIHFLLYKDEMEKATEEYLMERKKARYEYESRNSIFAPERKGIFRRRNKAAKLIDKKVAQDWEEYLEKCKKILSEGADKVTKKEAPAAKPAPPSGVNDLSEQAARDNVAKAPPEDLPITTLQACDELVNYAARKSPFSGC